MGGQAARGNDQVRHEKQIKNTRVRQRERKQAEGIKKKEKWW